MKSNKVLLNEIKDALAKDPSFKNSLEKLNVLVNDGVVSLGGSVDNIQLKKLANQIIASVSGVRKLIEDLRVETTQPSRFGVLIDWASGRIVLTR